MFDYAQFKDNLNIWKRKPLFWLIIVFLWPLFLLWFLVLWSINDLKKRPSNKKIYQTKGLYGLLIAFLILLGGVNSSLKDSESKTKYEDKVSISSSSKKTSSVDKTSLASSEAKSASESSKIASSKSVDNSDPYTSNEKYSDADGKNNEQKITSDALNANEYVGKSIHFSKAKVIVVNKDKATVWIRGDQDQSTNLGQINLQSKYYTTLFKVGDVVSVDGIYLGKQNDLLMSSYKYPTLDIININKQ